MDMMDLKIHLRRQKRRKSNIKQLNIKTQTKVYVNSNQPQELYWEAKLRQIFNIPKAGTGFYTSRPLGCRWTKLYLGVITRNICHLCDILYLRSPVAKAKKMLTTGSEVNAAISSVYLKVLLFIYLAYFFQQNENKQTPDINMACFIVGYKKISML